MKKIDYKDFPFDDVAQEAERLALEGHQVYQKFTCVGCGQRLTIDVANQFFETGSCDKCDAITDIRKQGCNMMVHARLK